MVAKGVGQAELRNSLPLTDRLKIDNSSAKARKNLTEWRVAKEARNGSLTLFIVCGDSRIVTADIAGDNKIVSISSIASSGDLKPFEKLLQHPSVGRVVVVGHFDHEKITPDNGKLGGCGGVDASIKIAAGKPVIEGKELKEYIGQKVTPNFFKNVKKTVEDASFISGKPVLGVMVDHLTDSAFPFIELNNGKEIMYPENYLENFQWEKVDDVEKFIKDMYGDKFPQLKIEDLLPEFRKFIIRNRKKALERFQKDPGFIERQRVQNPSTVVISTCPVPVALRYPDTFGRPNEAFVIRKAFDKGREEAEVLETDIDFKSIVGQLFYPLKQANFSRTNTILIETPNIQMSEKIASRLLQIDFVKDWVERRQGRIIVAQLESHETKELKYYS